MNGLAGPSSHALKALAVAAVALAALSYGFVPERADNDVWWHVKSGKVIVDLGRPPEHDPFTFAGENLVWHNHEWLAQAAFYKLYEWGGGVVGNLSGLRALIGFKSLVLAATFLLVLVRVQQRCRCLPLAAAITILALDVSRYTLYPRPPIFTYLLMAFFLLVLENCRAGRWPRWTLLALPPLTGLWANLHGGFLVAPFLIGFYAAGEVAEHFFWPRGENPEAPTRGEQTARPAGREAAPAPAAAPGPRGGGLPSRLVWLGGILAACLAATLCTPYGVQLYALFFRVMGASALVKTIAEMRSPLSADLAPHYLSFFVMAALIVAGLGAARRLRLGRPPAADLFLLLFFGYQGAAHLRHLPLFAIAAAPILGWTLGRMLERADEQTRRRATQAAAVATVLLLVSWAGLRDYPNESYWSRNLRLARGETYVEANFPKDLCDFIVANQENLKGRMFNPVNCAGFLIFRLSPERYKVFTDSRFDVFGDRFIWDEWAVSGGVEREDWDRVAWERLGLTEREGQHVRERCRGEGWQEILDRWQIHFVITEYSWKVRSKLRLSRQWERVFYWTKPFEHESGYELFVRKTPENLEAISRCRASFERFKLRYDPSERELP